MKKRILYIFIASIIIASNLYNLYWVLKIILKVGFQSEYNLSLFVHSAPILLAITGGISFLGSRFRNSHLLRIFMCYNIIKVPLWQLILYLFKHEHPDEFDSGPHSLFFYMNTAIMVLELAACCIGLWYCTRDRVLKTFYNTEFEIPTLQFYPASKAKRFANRLIDFVIIVFILYTSFLDNPYFRGISLRKVFGGDTGLLLLEILLSIVFYGVLEGIFKTTPGKCVTDTIIVNDYGDPATFGQAVKRTFCRLIPFESFTFLDSLGRGWHDTLSVTYVAESIYISDDAEQEEIEASLQALNRLKTPSHQ